MREIKTIQFDTWAIGYTKNDIQIGCQRHPIDSWRKWRENFDWIDTMDPEALSWAEKYLDLVLSIVDAAPAR